MSQPSWCQAPLVAGLAARLAARVGAVRFLDRYARDLTPSWLAGVLGGLDGLKARR